ncbi:MAG: mechanosensitive ion channel [Acidimicrobiales bacterium]|nr:mechanosensitive ion channel [Acidimicrobiales bacterium]
MPFPTLPLAQAADTAATTSDSITGSEWLSAGIALTAGFMLGGIVSRIVVAQLAKDGRPVALQKSARALGSLVFSVIVIIGLIVGLGIIQPESLDELRDSVISYIPRALSAAIVVIGASVISEVLASILERSLGQLSATMRSRILSVVNITIMGFAALIAASQLGVDTSIIQQATAALFFGIALAAALMVGLGSRDVVSHLAAGRALQRVMAPSDEIVVGEITGEVLHLHATAIEVEAGDGQTHLIPNGAVLEQEIQLHRKNAPPEAESADPAPPDQPA